MTTTTAAATREPIFGRVVAMPPSPDGDTKQVTVATKPPGRIDLVLEGGGVKGLGLAGAVLELDAQGYTINRVAGASAGAIVASLVAALLTKGRPLTDIEHILQTVDYSKFAPAGAVDKLKAGFGLVAHQGLYDGDYLTKWLGAQLAEIGVETFGDLRMDDDALPPERRYRLVLTVSDITHAKCVRLPWEYSAYGRTADDERIVDAVRASMSIPFFFRPIRVRCTAPNGEESECTWVDGGMLDNYPVDVFDRLNGEPGRWPTVGVKLSAMAPPPVHPTKSTFEEAMACLSTLTDNADRFYVVPSDAQRTIFVDHGTVQTTNFGITPEQQQMLLGNGRSAVQKFVAALS